jgi:hypothetical protein
MPDHIFSKLVQSFNANLYNKSAHFLKYEKTVRVSIKDLFELKNMAADIHDQFINFVLSVSQELNPFLFVAPRAWDDDSPLIMANWTPKQRNPHLMQLIKEANDFETKIISIKKHALTLAKMSILVCKSLQTINSIDNHVRNPIVILQRELRNYLLEIKSINNLTDLMSKFSEAIDIVESSPIVSIAGA